jgi:hypothetical protein
VRVLGGQERRDQKSARLRFEVTVAGPAGPLQGDGQPEDFPRAVTNLVTDAGRPRPGERLRVEGGDSAAPASRRPDDLG